jgi:hypothetical protein
MRRRPLLLDKGLSFEVGCVSKYQKQIYIVSSLLFDDHQGLSHGSFRDLWFGPR